jgi:hypothetical protein
MVGVRRLILDLDQLLAVGRQHGSCQAVRPSSPTRSLVRLVTDSGDEKVEELTRTHHHDRQEVRRMIPVRQPKFLAQTFQERLQTIRLAAKGNCIQLLKDQLEVRPFLDLAQRILPQRILALVPPPKVLPMLRHALLQARHLRQPIHVRRRLLFGRFMPN